MSAILKIRGNFFNEKVSEKGYLLILENDHVSYLLQMSVGTGGLVWSNVSPWLYQSRAVAKHTRPETDTARVILWTSPIRGLDLFHPNFIEIVHDAIVYDMFLSISSFKLLKYMNY